QRGAPPSAAGDGELSQRALTIQARDKAYSWTVRIVPARGIDFLRRHPARDIAHLLADVVVPNAGRESCELSAQIDRRLSLEPRSAGFAVDFAVTGTTRCDAAQGCPACDDKRRLTSGRT